MILHRPSASRAIDLVAIAACEYEMGSTLDEVDGCVEEWRHRLVDPGYRDVFRDWIRKEHPSHRVRIDAFRIGRYPVTNRDYSAFPGATNRLPESMAIGRPPSHPVWGVSHEDAVDYARWLSQETGTGFRLPTEAEWECAARGPEHAEYPFGRCFDPTKCNTIEAGIGTTTPVDRYPDGASGYGVCDLAGNVEEWTSSFYVPYPSGVRIDDDISRNAGPRYRVLRGGSFALGGDLARCARRHGPHPGPQFRYRGFRLVAT